MTATLAAKPRPATDGQRFVLYSVGWEGYQTLLKLVGDRPIRLTYDRGNLELRSPGCEHERQKSRLGFAVEAVAEELDIPLVAAGSTTFHREDKDRGLEPDECYYLTSAGRVHDWNHVNLAIDPPPDLAIEIEITRSALDRQGIYAALGIPEVWRFDGTALVVLLLRAEGTYAPSETSAAFPFLPMAEVARFLREHDPRNDTRWGRAFREWVRAEVVPRYPGQAGGERG